LKELNIMTWKAAIGGAALVCALIIFADSSASAGGEKSKGKSRLAGVWQLTGGEMKIEFADKGMMKLFPHGDSDVIVIVCQFSAEKQKPVKAKITEFEGKEEAIKKVKELLPVGLEFSFKWQVKDALATLSD